jgi:uncharacterized phage-associated protein
MDFNAQRFKELLLYVAKRSYGDERFGATKLNKLLFFSDFLAYAQLGRPITGATYQKLRFGPAPRELLPMERELSREGALKVKRQSAFNPDKRIAMREPDISIFSPEEIAVVDEVLGALKDDPAWVVSEKSHALSVGWQLAELQEDIPYQTIFVHAGDAHPAAIDRGVELAEAHGWLSDAVPA